MTILAGIFSRSPGHHLGESTCRSLTALLSRSPGGQVTTFRDDACCLAKIDFGAFGSQGFCNDPTGSVTMVVGEPLLAEAPCSRSEDVRRLHEAWGRDDWRVTSETRGVYCGAHYDSPERRLKLVSDRVGLRPLYYWVGEDEVVFASALRILEQVPTVPKRMDVRGVVELSTLGYPLGDRTPYAGIAVLRAAEAVEFSTRQVRRTQYWRWDEVPPSAESESRLADDAYDRFTAAVTARLRGDTSTVSFLTGGLDSRCVVTTLRSRNVRVHTFNFSQPGTQDRAFAAEFASRIGTLHSEAPMRPEKEAKWSLLMAEAWGAARTGTPFPPQRPSVVWSGDGGSIGLGHVHMSRATVGQLKAGRLDAAIATFLDEEGARLASGLFHASVAQELAPLPAQGVREELDGIGGSDPIRRFYLFLLLNDQRRHLATHFEDIDLHRLEFQLPFYDGDFLKCIVSVPAEACLFHGFYLKWLERFPPVASSVPWQTYPGHLRCPLPASRLLQWQWDRSPSHEFVQYRRKTLVRLAEDVLHAADFPGAFLRRRALRLAAWTHRLGLRDYGYVLRHAGSFYRYWSRSGGKYSFPPVTADVGG